MLIDAQSRDRRGVCAAGGRSAARSTVAARPVRAGAVGQPAALRAEGAPGHAAVSPRRFSASRRFAPARVPPAAGFAPARVPPAAGFVPARVPPRGGLLLRKGSASRRVLLLQGLRLRRFAPARVASARRFAPARVASRRRRFAPARVATAAGLLSQEFRLRRLGLGASGSAQRYGSVRRRYLIPASENQTATWVRDRSPRRSRMCWTWLATVPGVRTRASAMRWLL